MSKIIEKEQIAPNIHSCTVDAPGIAKKLFRDNLLLLFLMSIVKGFRLPLPIGMQKKVILP